MPVPYLQNGVIEEVHCDGTKTTVQVNFEVPDSTGLYSYTLYAAPYSDGDTNFDNQVSVSSDTVEVTDGSEGDDDEEPTDPEPEPEPEPDVQELKSPDVEMSDDGTVEGVVYFENRGDDMPERHLVEMQVREQGMSPLSFVSSQDVCDEDHPENVNREFELSEGEAATVELETQVDPDEDYTVHFITVEDCHPDNNPVEPYRTALSTDIDGNVGGLNIDVQNPFVIMIALGFGLVAVIGYRRFN